MMVLSQQHFAIETFLPICYNHIPIFLVIFMANLLPNYFYIFGMTNSFWDSFQRREAPLQYCNTQKWVGHNKQLVHTTLLSFIEQWCRVTNCTMLKLYTYIVWMYNVHVKLVEECCLLPIKCVTIFGLYIARKFPLTHLVQ